MTPLPAGQSLPKFYTSLTLSLIDGIVSQFQELHTQGLTMALFLKVIWTCLLKWKVPGKFKLIAGHSTGEHNIIFVPWRKPIWTS